MGKAFIAVIAALVAAVHGEAEAEADPAVLYGGYYGHPGAYGYGGYGYGYGLGGYYGGYYGYPYGTYGTGVAGVAGVKSAPCVNAANVPVPCAAGRKRRDAEAEAEPAVLYGGYYGYPGAYNRFAYGYGYGLGAYGYAGLGGYYG